MLIAEPNQKVEKRKSSNNKKKRKKKKRVVPEQGERTISRQQAREFRTRHRKRTVVHSP